MAEHALLVDGADNPSRTVILAHGAGAPMDSEFMEFVATRLGDAHVRVVRFEFPYMAERRKTGRKRPPNTAKVLLESYRQVVEQVGCPADLVLGGKSMGGRIASMLVDAISARGLLCLGYPFHPPGARDRLRVEHLQALETPALIVQGERDTFGTREEVSGYPLDRRIQIAWIDDGDHSFKPRKKSGHTLEGNLQACVAAASTFIGGL